MRLEARAWVSCCDMHFLRLLQGSQCWRHKDQRRAKDALARRCATSAEPWERGECGFAMFSKGTPAVFDVTGNQWGAAPFTLGT